MRAWILLLPLVLFSLDAQAAPCSPDAATTEEIKIGSTFPFGTTNVGSELTRTFRLINKDGTRPMTITHFVVDVADLNHNPWLIKERPSSSIPPGGDDCFTVTLIGMEPGVFTAGFSWDADTDPPSEEDTFFTFDMKGEVLAQPKGAAAEPAGQ
jgi:hypothetical protein